MDDRELIRRIMEEVKDEKLREELLALVVEKNKKRDATKQEEEKPIDYVARQEILFGATERVAKVEWWISLIVHIVLILVGSLGPLLLLAYFLTPAEPEDDPLLVISLFLSLLFIAGISGVFALLSGRKEYKRFKRKREG
jgi:hypothetical protein